MASFLDKYSYLRPQAQTVAQPPKSYPQFLSRARLSPTGTVLGDSTSGGGGNTGGGTTATNTGGGGGSTGPSAEDLALQAWRAAISQANDIRSNGRNTFDTLLKSVNAYRDRSKEFYNNADQQITNASSEALGSNARTAEELSGLGRAQGRALGLGDSSKFNRQQKVNSNLASTQGSTIANRGENQRANTTQLGSRMDTAQTNEDQANNYLKGVNDSANQVESAGVQNYGGALQNILDYSRQLSALSPLNAGSLTQYAPNLSSIQNTLGGVLGTLGSTGSAPATPGGDTAGNLANPTDILSLLKTKGLLN